MNNTNTATVRTTVNGTVLTGVIIALANLFGWTIQIDDLAPFLPLFAGGILVFYRFSLWLTDRWPAIGYILFGKPTAPVYGAQAMQPAVEPEFPDEFA